MIAGTRSQSVREEQGEDRAPEPRAPCLCTLPYPLVSPRERSPASPSPARLDPLTSTPICNRSYPRSDLEAATPREMCVPPLGQMCILMSQCGWAAPTSVGALCLRTDCLGRMPPRDGQFRVQGFSTWQCIASRVACARVRSHRASMRRVWDSGAAGLDNRPGSLGAQKPSNPQTPSPQPPSRGLYYHPRPRTRASRGAAGYRSPASAGLPPNLPLPCLVGDRRGR